MAWKVSRAEFCRPGVVWELPRVELCRLVVALGMSQSWSLQAGYGFRKFSRAKVCEVCGWKGVWSQEEGKAIKWFGEGSGFWPYAAVDPWRVYFLASYDGKEVGSKWNKYSFSCLLFCHTLYVLKQSHREYDTVQGPLLKLLDLLSFSMKNHHAYFLRFHERKMG